jgi:DNA primase
MSVLDDVKQRLDIVEVVSGYVALTQSGRNFKARCPFHTEKTPSFTVTPERQSWHCFGACSTGGDLVTFIMKVENLGFPQALRLLAQRAGVEMPDRRREERQSPLLQVNEAAVRFYHELLLSSEGAEALAYLEGRGVSPEAVRDFALGWSPREWERLRTHLAGQGFPDELMLQAGLLHSSPEGRLRDLFHARLLFPIRNPAGQTVGIGGRTLDGSVPKYLNTPQTPLFNKSRLLYALDAASEAIKLSGEAVIVEGYMDALMTHQHGFRNVVASMGTALTRQQVEQLLGLGSSFVLALDPDTAGQEATLRSLEGSWDVFRSPPRAGGGRAAGGGESPRAGKPQITLRVALLPQGMDPDELVRQDPQGWARTVAEAPELLDFLLDVLPPRYDLTSPTGRLQLAERFSGLLLAVEDSGRQDRYLARLEQLLGVNRRTLDEVLNLSRRALLKPGRTGKRAQTQGYAAPFAHATSDPLEEHVLALLVQYPELKETVVVEEGAASRFQRAESREIFTKWASCSTIGRLQEALDPSLHDYLESLRTRSLPPMDLKERQDTVAQCLKRLEERQLRELKAQESDLLASAEGDPEGTADLVATALERNNRLRQILGRGTEGA